MIMNQGFNARVESDGRFFFWVVVEKTDKGELEW